MYSSCQLSCSFVHNLWLDAHIRGADIKLSFSTPICCEQSIMVDKLSKYEHLMRTVQC